GRRVAQAGPIAAAAAAVAAKNTYRYRPPARTPCRAGRRGLSAPRRRGDKPVWAGAIASAAARRSRGVMVGGIWSRKRLEVTVQVPLGPDRVGIVGAAERNLKMIREALGVNITSREGSVRLSGERGAVSVARNVLERLGSTREQGLSRE